MSRLLRKIILFCLLPGLAGIASIPLSPASPADAQLIEPALQLSRLDAPPFTADAGSDQSVGEGSIVQLEGSAGTVDLYDSDYETAILADQPISYWPFDDGAGTVAPDVLGGVNGAIAGAGWIEDSAVGSGANALHFDGSNDYVALGRPASLRTPNYSAEVWTRVDGTGPVTNGENPTLVRSRWYGLSMDVMPEGHVNVWYFPRCSGSLTQLNSSARVNDGEWHHIVAAKDGTDSRAA